jgi:ribonuclease VapC
MADVLLDASALLAVINDEPGAEVVLPLLEVAAISAVNHAEVISKMIEDGVPIEDVRETMLKFVMPVIAFDAALGERTGSLRGETINQGLSLADRACLALAEREGLPVLTADRRWAELGIGVEIRLVR